MIHRITSRLRLFGSQLKVRKSSVFQYASGHTSSEAISQHAPKVPYADRYRKMNNRLNHSLKVDVAMTGFWALLMFDVVHTFYHGNPPSFPDPQMYTDEELGLPPLCKVHVKEDL